MLHVIADAEGRARGGGLRASGRRLRPRAPPVPARQRLARVAHLAVGQVVRDLVDEAARHVPLAPAEQRPRTRVRDVELLPRARDADVAEPPLLVEIASL